MAEAILASNLQIGSNSLDAFLSIKEKQVACALHANNLTAAIGFVDEMHSAILNELVKAKR